MLNRMALILVLLSTTTFASEYVVVPHIATDTASFQTKLVLENRSSASITFSILAYAGDVVAGSLPFTLTAGQRQTNTMEMLFPGKAVTHLFVDKVEELFAGVEYIPNQNPDNRTYVEGIRDFSQRWRIHPSNWQNTFDGLALVGPSCFQIDVSITQYSADGEYLAAVPMEAGALFGFGKLIYNLGQVLQPVEGSYVEVLASHPIAAMGLKGALDDAENINFLVGNQASAYPPFEATLKQLRENRKKWQQSALVNNYRYRMQNQCFCANNRAADVTVEEGRLSSLTYSDDGTDVALDATRGYHTIDELFELVEQAIAMGIDNININYDETYGSPSHVYIDWSGCTADEETSIAVSDIGPGR